MIRMRKQVEQYIREARQSIWNLRSPALQTSTLDQALRESGERTVAGQPVRFEFLTRGTPAGASAEVDHQLLRIGQQAIHNAARHAQASRIRTELRYDDNAVLLRVSDDGRGFDPGARSPSSTGHYGITTMQERAEEIGARFRLKSAAGAGTVVEVAVPPSALRY
jgi:signal transduction histidine kinase